ncbi:MAG: hypothetical protein JO281_17310 [Pseudonocardiales bacterium]|nr:hypothetical protein [Pseudonocardiales bacterium]
MALGDTFLTDTRISQAIAGLADHQWREVLLDDDTPGTPAAHPWHTLPPFVPDMRATATLDYQPAGDYATPVIQKVSWLIDHYRMNPTRPTARRARRGILHRKLRLRRRKLLPNRCRRAWLSPT